MTGMREPGPGRKHLDLVGAAMREAIDTANRAKLTVRQHRTLLAVFALTVSYTKLEDRLYLAQLARIAWGVEWAEDWQVRKTSEDLRALESAGVIEREAPQGRPPNTAPLPRYRVAVRWPVVWLESHPDPGATNGSGEGGKSPRDRSGTDPDSGRKLTPGSGTPPRSSPRSSPRRTRVEGPVLPHASRQPLDPFDVNDAVGAEANVAYLRKIREDTFGKDVDW